jgi:hypothetical protein
MNSNGKSFDLSSENLLSNRFINRARMDFNAALNGFELNTSSESKYLPHIRRDKAVECFFEGTQVDNNLCGIIR